MSGDREETGLRRPRPPAEMPPTARARRLRASGDRPSSSAATRRAGAASPTAANQKDDPCQTPGTRRRPRPPPTTTPRTIWTDSQGRNDTAATASTSSGRSPSSRRDTWALFESADGVDALLRHGVDEDVARRLRALAAAARGSPSPSADGTSPQRGPGPPDFMVRETTAHVASERARARRAADRRPARGRATASSCSTGMVLGLDEGQPLALQRRAARPARRDRRRDRRARRARHHAAASRPCVLRAGWSELRPPHRHAERERRRRDARRDRAQRGPRRRRRRAAEPALRAQASRRSPTSRRRRRAAAESTLERARRRRAVGRGAGLYELGPRDERYIVRIDDDGTTRVIFGDGSAGRPAADAARERRRDLPHAASASPGIVGAERITLLQTRPLGIAVGHEPAAADRRRGAARTATRARANAPLTVLDDGPDRLAAATSRTSRARSPGSARRRRSTLWRGEHQLVHLTVAAANGDEVATTSELFENLVEAIDALARPGRRGRVDSYARRYFNVAAELVVDATVRRGRRARGVRRPRSWSAFSFERRAFGQPVTAAEVVDRPPERARRRRRRPRELLSRRRGRARSDSRRRARPGARGRARRGSPAPDVAAGAAAPAQPGADHADGAGAQ